jgi:lipoprotein-releasing system ATP-binding protein
MGAIAEPGEAAMSPKDGTIAPRRERAFSASPNRVVPRPASTDAGTHVLAAHNVVKTYRKGQVEIPVLRGVRMAVRRGEFLSIVGQSGSGKSTLLHLLGALDVPDEGEIRFEGARIDNLAASERDRLRNRRIGMVFQFYHLLPELTTLENVLAPRMIGCGLVSYFREAKKHKEKALRLLEMVGLTHRANHYPRELSGGEMQRAAIARALSAEPSVLLADEPTGNLDRGTGEEILKILYRLNDADQMTVVMVTHDLSIAARAHRTVRLVEGRLESA